MIRRADIANQTPFGAFGSARAGHVLRASLRTQN